MVNAKFKLNVLVLYICIKMGMQPNSVECEYRIEFISTESGVMRR